MEKTKPEMKNKMMIEWRANPRMKNKMKTEMKIKWRNNYSKIYSLCMPENLINLELHEVAAIFRNKVLP